MKVLWTFGSAGALQRSFVCVGVLIFAACRGHQEYDVAAFENSKTDDRLAFEAIKELHRRMDDDLSGSVDINESIDFVREELHIEEKDRVARRQKAFHENNDEQVTVDDLWLKWLKSEVRHWTTDEMVYWLVNFVELPQYERTFVENKVNGSAMPRLACPDGAYMKELQISNAVHRHKLQLKASDIVLFGFRLHHSSYAKDAVLIALLAIAIVGYWFAIYQRRIAHGKLKVLSSHLDRLKDMEHEFTELQKKMEDHSRSGVHDTLESDAFNEDAAGHRIRLQEMDKLLEGRIPMLQKLLGKTYEIESARLNQEKMENLKEMHEAREWVEKLRKKHSSFMTQIRSVHGAEGEQIDSRVLMLRQKMERTARSLEEHHQRWSQIEVVCGFPITTGSSVYVSSSALLHIPAVKALPFKHTVKSASETLITNSGVDRSLWPTMIRSEECEDVSNICKSSADHNSHVTFSCTDEATPVAQPRRQKLLELGKSGSFASTTSCNSKEDGSESSATTDSKKRSIFFFKKIKLH